MAVVYICTKIKIYFTVLYIPTNQLLAQWRSHWGGKGGQSATPDSEKIAKKIGGKSGKIRKNREEKAKIGKFLSLCPSWQIGLATLLCWLLEDQLTQSFNLIRYILIWMTYTNWQLL